MHPFQLLLSLPLVLATLVAAAPTPQYNMAGPPPGGYLGAAAANAQAVDDWNNADWGDGWNFKKE